MNSFLNKPLYRYFPLLLLPLLAGCSKQEEAPVPISLTAQSRGLEAEGRAMAREVIQAGNAFSPTLFSTTVQGDYTYTATASDPHSWVKNVSVAASSGTITFPAGNPSATDGFSETGTPYYLDSGDWMYLVGVHPAVTVNDAGTVTYTIDGKTDILYAKEIKGNKWEGCHFPELNFVHLLTQLQLKAVKQENGGLSVKVTSITLKGVPQQVSFPLNKGTAAFSDTKSFTIPDSDISDDNISGTGSGGKVDLVTVLLPPRSEKTYSMDVTTNIGTFTDVIITLSGEGENNGFQAGYAYEITLNVTDRALSVETVNVTPWSTTDADGEMNIH